MLSFESKFYYSYFIICSTALEIIALTPPVVQSRIDLLNGKTLRLTETKEIHNHLAHNYFQI